MKVALAHYTKLALAPYTKLALVHYTKQALLANEYTIALAPSPSLKSVNVRKHLKWPTVSHTATRFIFTLDN